MEDNGLHSSTMNGGMESSKGPKSQKVSHETVQCDAESVMNLSLLDPPRWGWTAMGGVADLLPPHERSRRRSTAVAHRKQKRKRGSSSTSSLNGRSEASRPATKPPASVPALEVDQTVSQHSAALKEPPVGESATPTPMATQPLSESVKTSSTALDPPVPVTTGGPISAETKDNTGESAVVSQNTQIPPPPTQTIQQPEKPRPDEDGMEQLVGVKSEFLGMSIKKPSVNRRGTNSDNKLPKDRPNGKRYECTVDACKEGILDMYTYHRGREGVEPRDPDTGELLCPVDPSDTNYDCEGPRLSLNVTIEFPLEDETDMEVPEALALHQQALYRETIGWDLEDPKTPTPMVFAVNLSHEFGLDFAQTLELAMSIQQQIDAHIQQYCSYGTPLSYNDPLGNERRYAGSKIDTNRYGPVLHSAAGGTRRARNDATAKIQRTPASLSRQGSSVSSTTANTGAARRKSIERSQKEPLAQQERDESPIEPVYVEEVKRRCRVASALDVTRKCTNGVVGLLEKQEDSHCHVCHKRCKVAFGFACGILSHAYCEAHCQTRLGISEQNGPVVFDHCPICSLTCRCSKCIRRVEGVARDFKKQCLAQGTKPEQTTFEDVLGKCASAAKSKYVPRERRQDGAQKGNPGSKAAKSRPRGRAGARSEDQKPRWVPKPHVTEFPREVHGSVELEPGTPDDYLKVYCTGGSYLADDFPDAWGTRQEPGSSASAQENGPRSGVEMVEDGNVDYCHVCKNHGNLVCCDICPRAFHADCIPKGEMQTGAEDRWECFVCKKEKAGLEDDGVDGKNSLELICGAFLDADASDQRVQEGLSALSMIHEMLLKLVDYDFGYMFSSPVNVANVPGYKDIVKKPMDIGTICKKLINGHYTSILKEELSFGSVLVAVLQDIELVWHNCFLFNFEGSAIYRMATVHKRRAQAIRERSFENLLSEGVKGAVGDYVKSCETARGQAVSNTNQVEDARERQMRARKPRSKHKITVKAVKMGVNRPVAILDSVCGRIVKVYSSMKTAGQAAQSLFDNRHKCEWPSSHDLVRSIIHRSPTEPSLSLFGYRWVLLDELRRGKVEFSTPAPSIFEVCREKCTFVFESVEEAASFSSETDSAGLRMRLASLPRSMEWVEIDGLKWRRPMVPGQTQQNDGIPADVPMAFEKDLPVDEGGLSSNRCAAFKEDLVTRSKLNQFNCIESAFEDWLKTSNASSTFPSTEAKSMEQFERFYLDGDRNVDGAVWRRGNGEVEEDPIKARSLLNDAVQENRPEAGKRAVPEEVGNGIQPLPPPSGTDVTKAGVSMDTTMPNKMGGTGENPISKKSNDSSSLSGLEISALKQNSEQRCTEPLAERQNGKDIGRNQDTMVFNTAS